MDILAHTLWAGVGLALVRRRVTISARTAATTMAGAGLPDVLQMLPVVAWWGAGGGTFSSVWGFAIAVPGQEPWMPPVVTLISHHLHCLGHSAVIAGLVTWLLWRLHAALWIPLLGWWSHIVIDVFTHSADFYPSPVLYPFTERGFDGIAWNTPWFMLVNYLALGAAGVWILADALRRRHEPTRLGHSSPDRP